MNNFRELLVWEKAVDLATKIYVNTDTFPRREIYGLTSQIRRSVVSISCNIAEGAGRRSINEFRQFLDIALASSFELETQLLIANNLGYLNRKDFDELKDQLNEIQKMIFSLAKSLNKNLSTND